MGIVLTNALLCDIDPIGVEGGSLRIDGDTIVERGSAKSQAGDEVIDCGGAVVLPGLVNGHTHLYSALAVGMPAPPKVPTNFHEILKYVWWRLDQALDDASNEMSATIGALDALHCGTTTLIDHHAAPRAIGGSLDAIERGISAVGVRGVLCYEVTDRHGKAGAQAGIDENRRYIAKTQKHVNSRFAGLAGAHASFTMSNESLAGLAALAKEFGTGVHIHVAEDGCDDAISRQQYGQELVERLKKHDLFRPWHIFGHCIHLGERGIAALNDSGVTVAHNARSNMNNAVGYAPIGRLNCPLMLGTDGIGADMFAESKAAWFKSRDGGAGISPARVIEMLATSARRASPALNTTLGKLRVGTAGDVVVTDYVPFSPLTSENFSGHFVFAMSARNVKHVIAGGKLALKDRVVQTCDENDIRRRAQTVAKQLWQRMDGIPA